MFLVLFFCYSTLPQACRASSLTHILRAVSAPWHSANLETLADWFVHVAQGRRRVRQDCNNLDLYLNLHPNLKWDSGSHRGGGEYGLDWWEGGRLHKKQNGFDDFASCAQYLHSAGFSSPAKLTIQARNVLTAEAQLWHQPWNPLVCRSASWPVLRGFASLGPLHAQCNVVIAT